jgi:hypothetical protein
MKKEIKQSLKYGLFASFFMGIWSFGTALAGMSSQEIDIGEMSQFILSIYFAPIGFMDISIISFIISFLIWGSVFTLISYKILTKRSQ